MSSDKDGKSVQYVLLSHSAFKKMMADWLAITIMSVNWDLVTFIESYI